MNIIDIHMHGDDDNSPLQMISTRRLAYYQNLETALREVCQTLGMLAQEQPPTRDHHAEKPDSP